MVKHTQTIYQLLPTICLSMFDHFVELAHDRDRCPLICYPNQWTGFYMITASVIKELNKIEVGEKKVLKAKSLLSKVSKV